MGRNYQHPLKVVRGSNAAPGQYPFMVSVQRFGSHVCGGSLIAPNWDAEKLSSFKVLAGTNTLNSGGTTIGVSKIIKHPDHDFWNVQNDIALIQLSSPIKETSLIQIISLETTNDDSVRNVTLIGWGATSYAGYKPNNLQHLPLETITTAECKAYHSTPIVSSEICTLTKPGEGACHGDTGSPLIEERNKTINILIGVSSWGKPCAVGYPDVFMRVSSFTDWIKNETGITFS